MDKFGEKIQQYAAAGFPILYVDTFEEEKALRSIFEMSEKANRLRVYEWSVWGHSCRKVEKRQTTIAQRTEPLEKILNSYIATPKDLNRSSFVIKDIHPQIENPVIVGQLKYLAKQITNGNIKDCTFILISSVAKIPVELEHYVTVLQIPELEEDEIRNAITGFLQEQGLEVSTIREEFMEKLVNGFKGLPESEIRNILALIIAESGELSQEKLSAIREQKKQLVQKSGFLEMVEGKERLRDIGGLENLKQWLKRKASIVKDIGSAKAFGVDMPRGVLIAGMPGCGKSLCAKATAAEFGEEIPLLRLDVGNLLGKYVGESEKNMQKALRLAEAISPCVLWIDELEKALMGVGGQGGNAEVTTRLLGTLLTWMQERKHLVFVVATTNKVDNIPPEFMRKGRFDEIFYVALPEGEERESIFRIHIQKRRPKDQAITSDDIAELAKKTKGYSGADIEGVVKDAVEECFCNGARNLTMDALLDAIDATSPLSEIMDEEIKEMKKLFEKRNFKNASY